VSANKRLLAQMTTSHFPVLTRTSFKDAGECPGLPL
jgi:hypothetical protein